MKTRNLKNKVLVLFAFLSITGLSFAQDFEYEAERALAQDVFKSLQDGDLDLFKTYCTTTERYTKMLAEMGDETEMEKGLKGELGEMSPTKFFDEAIIGFNDALELAKTDSIDLKEASYPELALYKTRFDVTNLKSMYVRFDIFEDKSYSIKLDFLKTAENFHLDLNHSHLMPLLL